MGVTRGHVTQLWNYGTPHISGTIEAKNSKFGMRVDAEGNERKKNEKLGQWGSRGVHVTPF